MIPDEVFYKENRNLKGFWCLSLGLEENSETWNLIILSVFSMEKIKFGKMFGFRIQNISIQQSAYSVLNIGSMVH